jgi:DNA-binding MarR family transcriptional regulator
MASPNADTGDGSSSSDSPAMGLGSALRRAWLGYQHRLDSAMADAGFGERHFPDGRLLRLCSDQGSTISAIGRELSMSRQGASKAVGHLRDRGYVVIEDSMVSKREKTVILTDLGANYLRQHRSAARAIEKELRAQLGESAFSGLMTLVDALDQGELPRMQTYLRGSKRSH